MITPETLWKLGRVNEPRLSPDKKMLIYGVKRYDVAENKGVTTLYKVGFIATSTPKAIADSTYNPSAAKYSSDGKRIGFLSKKSGSSQVWEMKTDGSSKHQVTNYPDDVNGFSYSPDGKHMMLIMEVKLDQTITEQYPDLPKVKAKIIDALAYRHWDQWEDESYSHIFYVKYDSGLITGTPYDIMKDQRFESPLQPMGGEEQICWSPDGKSIIYTCKKNSGTEFAFSTNSDLFCFDMDTKVTSNLTDGMVGYDQDPHCSADGKKLFWLSMEKPNYESDKNRLMCYDFDKKDKYEITSTLDRTVDNFCIAPHGQHIYFIAITEGTKQIYSYDFKSKKINQITHGDHDYLSVEWQNEKTLVGSKQSMSMPTELYTITISKGKETRVSHVNDEYWGKQKLGRIEKRFIKATDGKTILTWVIYPPDFDAAKKYPTLLYCQGGPQSPVSQFFSYRWNFQLMAANGYIIVAPNRRGLQGFGKEWNDQIIGDYGGQCIADYLSAIDTLAKEKYVDKDRLGCVGASFGGYSAYWLAGHHNKRFKCFISHCGMFNMESWYGTTEEMFFAHNDQKGSYWDNPTNYNKFSPHHFVQNWDAPILIIHNEKDFRVPIGQGMEAFTAAQSRNILSRFLYFPDENHWVSKPQNSILWQRVYFEWLDKWLKKD